MPPRIWIAPVRVPGPDPIWVWGVYLRDNLAPSRGYAQRLTARATKRAAVCAARRWRATFRREGWPKDHNERGEL